MTKRRRLWGRIILVYCFLGMFLLYCGFMIVISVLNYTDKKSSELLALSTDNTPPVIELKGGDSLKIAVGDPLEEPGISVYDESSIPRVEIDSNVDIAKEGTYRIKYTATDEAGNEANQEREVTVIRPTGRIYLTFDDGPSEYTATLLDVLNKYGVKATFFVTGYGDDDLIRREYSEGHTVGLHTMSHNYGLIYSSLDSYFADLDAVAERVRNITGQRSHIMRFPGGSSNLVSRLYDGGQRIMSTLVNEVSRRGYVYFDWNVDSDDAGRATTADEVFNNATRTLSAGGEYVILQHDVKPYSVEAVERIVKYGLENGFVFSRLRENSFTAHHGINN
ncbi:polysaccharide deacetylase family protein [Candidatus Saccharibacteria bacterium]|nr:polysaccharide deacetylase family protein [Candidatus Saccharibacteria bacterium]